MTIAEPLLLEREGAVLRLTLNRPEKRNALNSALIRSLTQVLRASDEDANVSVVMLEGAGEDFCAGADLESLARLGEAGVMENLADVDELADLFLAIRHARKPVVAVVRGRAMGGGCGLATACDLVLAAESARFAYSEILLGFVPAMVMTILRRNVSEKRAFEMMVTGATFSATEAAEAGLINHVFPDDQLTARATEFVGALAERSPSAVQLTKRLFHLHDGMTFDAAIRAGADVNALARLSEDTRAGVARFLQQRRPR